MSANYNPSAFPLNTGNDPQAGAFNPEPGMSLRDWFAGQALSRIVGARDSILRASWVEDPRQHFAEWAYAMADAMLVERAKGDRS